MESLEYEKLPARLTPPAAATTTAVTATTAIAVTAAATRATLRTGTRFVYVQSPAVQFLPVQCFDCFGRFGCVGHFDEGKAAGLSGIAVAHYAGLLNCAVRGKGSFQLRLCSLVS
jgi:hypothetical protein